MVRHALPISHPLAPGQVLNDRLPGLKVGRIQDTPPALCVGWGEVGARIEIIIQSHKENIYGATDYLARLSLLGDLMSLATCSRSTGT